MSVHSGGDRIEPGSVVGGYRIDALVGRGGMGVVYRATNLTLGQTYALKVLAPDLADDEQFRERFRREIRLAASLHHPHAIGVHYAGEHDGLLFLAMDFIEGTDLREVIRRDGALEPHRAVELLAQITSALDAAHQAGLVHRDVKPANVLIRGAGEEHAYLTDFGLAKRLDTRNAMTARGLVVGTVDYMPPEQITGAETDARTDVYAVGCVLFQMLSGKVPYERDNTAATMWAHVYEPPPSVQALRAELHPAFDAVIAKAMAKDPADRYLSAGDFARDTRAALEGMRYTGNSTIVATGEARPHVATPSAQGATPPGATRPVSQQQNTPGDGAAVAPVAHTVPATLAGTTVAHATVEPTETQPGSQPPDRPPSSVWRGRRRWLAVPIVAVVGGAIVAIVALGSGSSSPVAAQGPTAATTLAPVPTNHVTAAGRATVTLKGDVATVTVDTNGLLNGAPHAMHIHGAGLGQCPPASAARLHDGHLAISTTNGIPFYGPPVTSLTTSGDTSPKSIVAFGRYPSVGNIRYTRTITLTAPIAAYIRQNAAVIVVHGIDYNSNGIYDDVLDRSELNRGLPGEATAPALCGVLVAAQKVAARSAPLIYTASLTVQPGRLWFCDIPLPAAPRGTRARVVARGTATTST